MGISAVRGCNRPISMAPLPTASKHAAPSSWTAPSGSERTVASVHPGLPEQQRRIVHLEAGRALVIFHPGLPGVGIEELLALFLEVTLFEHEAQAIQRLPAVILDEIGASRALPLVRRQVLD